MDSLIRCSSPLGPMLLASDGRALIGLWFEGQEYEKAGLSRDTEARELPVFTETLRWLDRYFAGLRQEIVPPLAPRGTPFQRRVWERLERIPYGETLSYGELARELGCASARAVGQAVGRNPISLLIPCHRVLGKDGRLTGYAGGTERKAALLRLEGIAFLEEGAAGK